MNIIKAYTDGSLFKKNNKIYCGYGIYFSKKEYENISEKFDIKPITNNRAELYAIYRTIKICNKINETNKIDELYIYSDSEYCVKTFNIWYKTWIINKKKYKNNDIIDDAVNLINNATYKINIIHILSHTNNNDENSINNNIADQLAKNGAIL